jgi:hypothetical protein
MVQAVGVCLVLTVTIQGASLYREPTHPHLVVGHHTGGAQLIMPGF